jgi:hypothetical protein
MANAVQLDPNQTPEIVFISSNKDKRLISINDYVYQHNKSTPKVSYWTCEEKTCRAGIHLDSNDRFIKFTKFDHTHMPVPDSASRFPFFEIIFSECRFFGIFFLKFFFEIFSFEFFFKLSTSYRKYING